MRRLLIIFAVASCGRTGIGGAIEPATFDAGVTPRDAGLLPSIVRFPDGGCPEPRFATREALSRSPRPNRLAEFAIIESGDEFVADNATYARAASELVALQAVDAGKTVLGFLAASSNALFLRFAPDAGALAADGGYTDWSCLNEAYGGRPSVTVLNNGRVWADIDFRPIIDVQALVADYARLPGLLSVEAQPAMDATSCCTASDLCLDLGPSGQFTWLAQLNDACCAETVWLRLRSQADGGRELERVNTPPTAWFEAAPRCAMRLASRPWRHADGGIVEFDAGR